MMVCPFCKGTVDVLKGPEEYTIKKHQVWHHQCYEKHKFMGCGQVVHKTKTKIEGG